MLIAVEGIDGAGKSGVVRFILQHLRDRGITAIETREPGGTVEGERIRDLLVADDDTEWDPTSELLLINAARAQHVRKVIAPALNRNSIVIVDRFIGSTIAYQGAGRGVPEGQIKALHQDFATGLYPDITLVLDIDVASGIARSVHRLSGESSAEGKFERLSFEFHDRVRQSFLLQAAEAPDRHVIIDASLAPERVKQLAWAAVEERLPAGQQRGGRK